VKEQGCLMFKSPVFWFIAVPLTCFIIGYCIYQDCEFRKPHVIYRVEKGVEVESFEISGDTAILRMSGFSDSAVSSVKKLLKDMNFSGMEISKEKLARIILQESQPYSTIKLPINGIGNPVVVVDYGWDTPDTLCPPYPRALYSSSCEIGGILDSNGVFRPK
jgi:hypothetical protein